MSGKDFNRHRSNAHTFYYQNTKESTLQNFVWNWMKSNGYSSSDIAAAKRVTGYYRVDAITGVLCKLLVSGCPDYNEAHAEYWESLPGTSGKILPMTHYIHTKVKNAIELGKNIVEEEKEEVPKVSAPVVSIQERMREQLSGLFEYFDGVIDEWSLQKGVHNFTPYEKMMAYDIEIKPAHAKIIKSVYEKEYAESLEIVSFKDPDIREAYEHTTVMTRKELVDIYERILSSCDIIIASNKSKKKSRKPKAVSKERLVQRLNYLEKDVSLKLVSINPIDIIGATELWVYNTKYKKLGKYVADNLDKTLSVKGSSIVGYDTVKSVQKTLRKPEEQLTEFNKAGKVALRKFLDEIKTKDAKMNGRLNKDTILLKVL